MSEENTVEYKKAGEKEGIVHQFLFGLWFLFWSLGIVWLVYKVGFIPMFAAMLVVSIISIAILGHTTKEDKTNNDN